MPTSEKYRQFAVDYYVHPPVREGGNLTIELLPSRRKVEVHTINFNEVAPDDVRLEFNYDVIDDGEDLSEDLITLLGDVLVSALIDGLTEHESREDNSKEPDTE